MHTTINKEDSFCFTIKKWNSTKLEDLSFLNKLSFSFKRHYVLEDFYKRIKEINEYFYEINNEQYYLNLSKCLLNLFLKQENNTNLKHFYFTLFRFSTFCSVNPLGIVFKIPMHDFKHNILNKDYFKDNNSNLISLFSLESFQNILLKNDNLFYMNSHLILNSKNNKILFQYLSLELNHKEVEIVPNIFFYNDYYKSLDYKMSFLNIKYFLINYRNFSNKSFLLLHKHFYIFFFKKKKDIFGILTLKNDTKQIFRS